MTAFQHAGHQVTAVDLRPAPAHLAGAARWRRSDFAAPHLLAEIASGRFITVVHQAGNSDTRAPAGPELGLDWIGLRYTNVFGLDEADEGPMASILSQLLRHAAGIGHIRVFDDSLTAARDYISVETVTTTIVYLATTRPPAPGAVYNLGAGCAVAFADIAQWCAQLHREATGQPLHVELVPNPLPGAYQYFTCADMTALDKALPDRPTESAATVQARAAELFETFRNRATR
ncbi:hypothetical protein OG369_39510 [Streptomyces sp. NBC_01221]|uniref:NAD-dependent epimerase/dehydratase family protein n=1 Tax=Streptomyces sp. NBC_01221 TaxID=2903782 RepID=UPI0022515B5C|nr:NAD-dependent epimerase/dehydratase family protein [Streptomyces sp. NBC_01221]MCX4791945.1 hypothetical protein [Streptomyces sp. NBC_01221]